MQSTENKSVSPYTGWTRAHWEELFTDLTKGFIKYSTPGKERVHYPGGQDSFMGKACDGIEGFARHLWMHGPWMYKRDTAVIEIDGKPYDLAAHYREGLVTGTDPQNPAYWGEIKSKHQTVVESGSMAVNLFLTRKHIWDKLTSEQQDQAAAWFQTAIGKEAHRHNWLLFKLFTNTMLKCFGKEYSQDEIDDALDFVVNMYAGDGWYKDGAHPCFEYYNAWSIHPYLLLWTMMDGDSRPEYVRVIKERTTEFLGNLKYFFAGNGVNVPYGRSAMYRFGPVGIFALAEFFGISPVNPGQARRIASGNVKFFIDNGAVEDHHLTMGFTKKNLSLAELYSGPQSPYWAVKCFWAFMLDADHPFWTATEEPLEVEKKDYIVPIPATGQIVQGTKASGQVQLVVNNSSHWAQKKYSNLLFSSHFCFDVVHQGEGDSANYNFDGGISASADGRVFITRQNPRHITTADRFSASYHCPFRIDPNKPAGGNEDENIRIYSALVLKNDYHVRVHKVVSTREFQLFEGAYALGYNSGKPAVTSGDGWEAAGAEGKTSFIRCLAGFNRQLPAAGFMGNPEGNNLVDTYSVTPGLCWDGGNPDGMIFASLVVPDMSGAAPADLAGRVKGFNVDGSVVKIVFDDGETVYVQAGEPADITLNLNGRSISGSICFARVAADGSGCIVYKGNRSEAL